MVSACWQRLQCAGFCATERGGDRGHRYLLQGLCVGSKELHPLPEVAEGS